MAFLRLEQVSKYYGDLCVVSDMNLSVEQGEFVSLLGPSGCGKTTTLQMIAGFADVTRGRITLDGRDITHAKPNTRGLGIVFQSYALFPHMTVRDNVAFGLAMRRVERSERDRLTREALAMVRLDKLGDRYPRELSGGQRQRVALARALVIRPPVLLLDEPLSNLDAQLREEMQFELRRIQRQIGTTTIMVTHDQAEALSISDRVVVMQEGRATQVDAPYRMYEHPSTHFISRFVGKTNMLDGTVARVDTVGAEIQAGPLSVRVDGTDMRAGDRVTISLRPEKVLPVAAGAGKLDGRVTTRYFLGSQWQYELDTAAGPLLVLAPNDGRTPHDDGATIGLDWSADIVRVLPAGAREA
ncbi:Fe3+/spermidine/putrescine ABC transporter ATP-binding protein [Bordetella genomosp. 1]|uniref:Fe3+/spermidine/putrescine ABC transporter ATP-binding protein n=1 Tax=Bordetella genomosp. 1 TaxID=1395607 RepID=A0A261SSX4_9BORD|nr:ABC transporter ATP-binding protein [Bordetella genomosp. 1]OZI39393.1 Fe3+/spermidine/putrescine ABC transporter ATP-binding protein [Bordetella genomosp. 1]OZI65609.1 Fe3+/spermidine/putrescine ABC transporter ATP-binding protein [Bordetella genomosp. 1]